MPTTTAVSLQFLLVSDDHSTLKTVKTALDGLSYGMNCSTSAGAARVYLSAHRVDGIIVDLPLNAAADLVASIRQAGANRRAFIFVCLGETEEFTEALKNGANVLIHKPLKPEAIASSIKTFQAIMESERRRYFRYHVTIPVTFESADGPRRAMMDNLSEGGMAVSMKNALEPSSLVEFSFELPFGPRVAGRSHVIWVNTKGMVGLEFRLLHDQSQEHLVNWLRNKSLQR
jgi:ActR/RegA family two-component response regulator